MLVQLIGQKLHGNKVLLQRRQKDRWAALSRYVFRNIFAVYAKHSSTGK
jgi:hypothetical protein